ncbi:MAG: thioredoxin [Clostridiales bacterium]|nr:thioredoxin [Clostridiales bacterium]
MAVITLTKENFQQEAVSTSQTVLVDFWAVWCGPCRMLSPTVDQIAEENPTIKVCKVNVDEQPELAEQFSIMSIPTLIVLKNGKVVNQSVGVVPKASIESMIQA